MSFGLPVLPPDVITLKDLATFSGKGSSENSGPGAKFSFKLGRLLAYSSPTPIIIAGLANSMICSSSNRGNFDDTGCGVAPNFQVAIADLKNSTPFGSARVTKSSWPKMKKEQDRARALRDLLVSTRTDEELDNHFANFAKPEVISLINEIGDIEKPVPLGLALLKKVPAFRKLALQAGVKLLFT